MKAGDLVTVIRFSPLKGKTALVLEVPTFPKDTLVTFCHCLIEGRRFRIPTGHLKVIG